MSTITDFQQKLLTDANARREFAADPSGFLKRNNILLPAGTKVPATIPAQELESTVTVVRDKLAAKGVNVDTLRGGDPASVSKFVEDAFQPRASAGDLDQIKKVMDGFATATPLASQDAATIAVVGAVVAAVVAVPVAVYGVAEQ